jgi:hypothetical protein
MKPLFYIVVAALFLTSCSTFFGDKQDAEVDDIFEQGRIDPQLVPQQIGYVPVFPFFQGFSHPVDVFVGYDEMIYVVDDEGVHVLDQKGTRNNLIRIPGATDVTQDRRLHTYIVGTVHDPRTGATLAAVYHLMNTATGNVVFVDTLIHPYCDDSRAIDAFTLRTGGLDEQVRFTGIAATANNNLYVSRTGPVNDVNSFNRPDNAVLVFDADGKNIGSALGLTPNSSSLKSALGISSIATLAAPPQRINGMSNNKSFVITQADPSRPVEYRVLFITQQDDPDLGPQYYESTSFLSQDRSKADRFLYEPGRFSNPQDCYVSPDNLGYIFVADAGKDSIYLFSSQGMEGIAPPPNSPFKKQVIVSFGGPGTDGSSSGPFSFKAPSGICYNRRIIFVADRDNNRICRYKLSTDLQ